VGVSPTGAVARSPVAWIARMEETKFVKPIDKAIFGMVSESPGRNESEPTGGPVRKLIPEAESAPSRRRQHGPPQPGRRGGSLRRGGRGSTVTRTRQATGETVLAPSRNRRRKVGRITGEPGKSTEGKTVAAGPVVAEKRGNARGAKGPCCSHLLRQQREAGAK